MHRETTYAAWSLAALRSALRAATITSLLILLPFAVPRPEGSGEGVRDAGVGALARVMAQHDCSPTGFAAHPRARAALVRTPDGELRLVGRRWGKAVYAGHRPGTLVAVCGL